MTLTTVESSMLYAVGYDEATQALAVVFRKKGVYHYHDVPVDVYEELLAASSIGQYMRDCIIDVYSYDHI